uniref:Uncharacterized protein n=1 Tax=Arundo donax TaxID=35708 RepID=A0A0A9C9Y3_ARUDO
MSDFSKMIVLIIHSN